ncbi:MAG TPA: cyclopropane-fatty-acyl-phospholipid synthase family protein [Acetobacteraceae bacterium]|nr:cyclopropane-fatty-acyl-phospholipid synthase family protein [Acetobacteraceae bacterium]
MLERMLAGFIREGRLTVLTAGGRALSFGAPAEGVADVTIRFRGRASFLRVALRPALHFGEAYMNGDLVLEQGTLADLFALVGRNLGNREHARRGPLARAFRALARRLQQHNPIAAARRNVAHHYDLSETLFRLFLDSDLNYSCAYFPRPDLSLEEAQRAKQRHIAAKLLLAPGQRVLDIGCGWGSLALALARMEEVRVDGVTLSAEQHARATARAEASGLADRVCFSLTDYREVEGAYDRIVSVGMFEHVGSPHYEGFFAAVRRLLAPGGVALIHSIGRMDVPGLTDSWTRKYIFPGGYVPALSEVLPHVERAGLWATDIEILRLHYAETLRHWRERFLAKRAVIRDIYDERFCRMWEFYLAGSEMGFRHGGLMVFQLQLARRVDTVPLTRDYIRATESALPV